MRPFWTALPLFFVTLALASPAGAADGDFDPSFDADGHYERPPAHHDGPRPDAQETILALATKNRPRPSMKPWEATP